MWVGIPKDNSCWGGCSDFLNHDILEQGCKALAVICLSSVGYKYRDSIEPMASRRGPSGFQFEEPLIGAGGGVRNMAAEPGDRGGSIDYPHPLLLSHLYAFCLPRATAQQPSLWRR